MVEEYAERGGTFLKAVQDMKANHPSVRGKLQELEEESLHHPSTLPQGNKWRRALHPGYRNNRKVDNIAFIHGLYSQVHELRYALMQVMIQSVPSQDTPALLQRDWQAVFHEVEEHQCECREEFLDSADYSLFLADSNTLPVRHDDEGCEVVCAGRFMGIRLDNIDSVEHLLQDTSRGDGPNLRNTTVNMCIKGCVDEMILILEMRNDHNVKLQTDMFRIGLDGGENMEGVDDRGDAEAEDHLADDDADDYDDYGDNLADDDCADDDDDDDDDDDGEDLRDFLTNIDPYDDVGMDPDKSKHLLQEYKLSAWS